MDLAIVDAVLSLLGQHSISQLLVTVLLNSRYDGHPQKQTFIQQWPDLLAFLASHSALENSTNNFTFTKFKTILTKEIKHMAEKESGWHIGAKHVRAEQLDAFTIDGMAHRMQEQAPVLSALLATLLDSDPRRTLRQEEFLMNSQRVQDGWDEEDEYWWAADLDMLGDDVDEEMDMGHGSVDAERGQQGGGFEGASSGEESQAVRRRKRQQNAANRRRKLLIIVSEILAPFLFLCSLPHQRRVVISSILLFSTNQKCNALPAVMGLFLHSNSTPEVAVEVFAHAGLSVSVTSTHNMVNSLSVSVHDKLRGVTKTKTFALAHDNFDIDFKSWSPTIEHPQDTLKHATSALALPLEHDVVAEHLEYCGPLWLTNPLNPAIPPEQRRPTRTWIDLLHSPRPEELGRQDRIFAWHFRNALVTHGEHFESFRDRLGFPETIMQIPVKQTTHIPCRAMDINSTTPDGQSDILEDLFAQANIGDPTDTPGVEDIRDHVVIVHGDLGTGERLEGAQASRRIERKPVRGLRNIVFVFGLFHMQMAAAEAIWRMFIEPKSQRTEPNGLYQQACKVRPHDSGRIGSKPTYRLLHELILQCAAARMLDVWRVEVDKRRGLTLEQFSKVATWSEIESLSVTLAQKYMDKAGSKDHEFRNNSLILARLLDYVELAHAMKHGDIGRVEATFLHWAFIFKSVGKHKYAAQLVKTANDLKYVYPEKLSCVLV